MTMVIFIKTGMVKEMVFGMVKEMVLTEMILERREAGNVLKLFIRSRS